MVSKRKELVRILLVGFSYWFLLIKERDDPSDTVLNEYLRETKRQRVASSTKIESPCITDLQNLSMELRRRQSTYLKRIQQQKESWDGLDLEFNMNGKMDEDELAGGIVSTLFLCKIYIIDAGHCYVYTQIP